MLLKPLPDIAHKNLVAFARYLATVLICLAIFALRWIINPVLGNGPGLLSFLFGICLISWYIGYGPGLLAIAVCATLSDYYLIYSRQSVGIADGHNLAQLVLFIILGLIINQLSEFRRRGQQRESEILDRFHHIVEEVPTGIVLISDSGFITFANQAASSLYGLTPGHMVGRIYQDAAWGMRETEHEADSPVAVGWPVQEALAETEVIHRVRLTVRRGGGERVELLASAICLTAHPGAAREVFVSVNEVNHSRPLKISPVLISSAASQAIRATSQAIRTVSAGTNGVAEPGSVPILYLDHTAKLSGGEIALARLLNSLDRARFRPLVLLAEEGPLVERLRNMGVDTYVIALSKRVRDVRKDTLGIGGTIRRVWTIVPLLAYTVKVAQFAKTHRVRVIHTNSLKSDLYGALAGRLAHIPVVWHVRDHIDPSYLPTPAVFVFRFLARHLPSYVVTNSESTREHLFLSNARPSAVVPSGLDLQQSVVPDGLGDEEMPKRQGDHKPHWVGPVRIGIVGRLAPWKGQHVFLEAAAKLRTDGYDISCFLIGSPLFGEQAYEDELRRLASTDLLRSVVHFLGFRKDVSQVLQELDILVHASTSPEPFGQVVIEGMAEGLPVIATDGGGVREIITDGVNGLLVPMGDSDALAQALTRLIKDPDEAAQIGQAGYWHVRRHFTSLQSSRRVEKVYGDLIAVS
jgi:PAS domain S-box-containing protein